METQNSTARFARIVLGLFLILYALNKFFHVVPTGYGEMPESAENFLDAIVYYLPALYIFEIIIGLLLITNTWANFIYVLLFPLSVSFMMFSIINQDFTEMIPAVVVAGLNCILLFSAREVYKPLFKS